MRFLAAFLFFALFSQIGAVFHCTSDADCGNLVTKGIGSSLAQPTNRGVCSIIDNTCLCNQGFRGEQCESLINQQGDGYAISDDMNVYRFNPQDVSSAPVKIGNISMYLDGAAEGMGAYDNRNDRLFLYGVKGSTIVLVVLDTLRLTVDVWPMPQDRDFISFQYDTAANVLRGMITNPLQLVVVNKTSAVNEPRDLPGITDVVNGFAGLDSDIGMYYYVAYSSVSSTYNLYRYQLSSLTGNSLAKSLPENMTAFAFSELDQAIYIVVPLNANQIGVKKVWDKGTDTNNFVGSTQISAQGVYFGLTALGYDHLLVRFLDQSGSTNAFFNNIDLKSSNLGVSNTAAFNPVAVFVRPINVGCDGTVDSQGLMDWSCSGACDLSDQFLCYQNGTNCFCPPKTICPAGQYANNKTCLPCEGLDYSAEDGWQRCLSCSGVGVVANANHTGCLDPTVGQLSTLINKYTPMVANTLYFFKDIISSSDVATYAPICYTFTYDSSQSFSVIINLGGILPLENNDLSLTGKATKSDVKTSGTSKYFSYCIPLSSFPAKKRDNSYQVNLSFKPTGPLNIRFDANYGSYLPPPPPPPPPTPTTSGNTPPKPSQSTGNTPTTGNGPSSKVPSVVVKPPPSATTPIVINQQSSGDKSGAASLAWIAGPVIGVICIVIIIVVIVVIIVVLRKKKTEKQEEMQTYGSIAPAAGGNYGSVDVAGGNYGSTAGGAAYGSTAGAATYGSAAGGAYGSTATASGAVYGEANGAGANNRQSAYAPSILREVNMANAIDYKELQSSGKILGQGAFGVVKAGVYRGRKVAIKEIKPDNVDERELKAFAEEADLMMQLDQHENVVAFIGVCTEPFCIVSEFMGKGDLNTYLLSDSAIPDMMKLKILLDIAKGMNFLAKQGIVHRDLAARNILLDDSMTAKVSDFGLSRLLDTESAVYTKSATGPVKWMAPEQLTKRKASEKSDVWMYGVLTFEVVTRGPPYPNMNLTEVCVSVANNQLRPTFPDSTPAILKELTDSIFNYTPDARPSFSDIVVKLSSNDDKSGYVLAPGENR